LLAEDNGCAGRAMSTGLRHSEKSTQKNLALGYFERNTKKMKFRNYFGK
jgi:hypothetical protein